MNIENLKGRIFDLELEITKLKLSNENLEIFICRANKIYQTRANTKKIENFHRYIKAIKSIMKLLMDKEFCTYEVCINDIHQYYIIAIIRRTCDETMDLIKLMIEFTKDENCSKYLKHALKSYDFQFLKDILYERMNYHASFFNFSDEHIELVKVLIQELYNLIKEYYEVPEIFVRYLIRYSPRNFYDDDGFFMQFINHNKLYERCNILLILTKNVDEKYYITKLFLEKYSNKIDIDDDNE